MINSFIATSTHASLFINSKPYVVDSGHPNFGTIISAARNKKWDTIPALIDIAKTVESFLITEMGVGDLHVHAVRGEIVYQGEVLHNVITQHIFKLMEQDYPAMPVVLFLNNLMQNPSKKSIDELYGWMERNGITISEDGYLLAHKRVNNDYKSFFDGTTDNSIGSTPELPRWKVDDRSENTCSVGLHFCSLNYLPHYQGGAGRALILKINPADVVSIPTDYNHAKGRACKYKVIGELHGDARARAEVQGSKVLTQPVLNDVRTVNAADAYKQGYVVGYKAGRGKQRNEYKELLKTNPDSFEDGYLAGYTDGRQKNSKLY